MKVIQTIVNCVDFQSRIIEIDMTWSDFKEYIYSHIYDGIQDDDIGVNRAYPIGKGLMIGSVTWYEVNQDDDVHLDIKFESRIHPCKGDKNERVLFLIMEN